MNREPGTQSGYSIDLQCPQCGAPVVLEETERIVACAYCRVRHFIANSGQPSYLIPSKLSGSPEGLYYVPYWRFKGMAFALQGSKVVHRLIDSSAQAVRNFALPYSLGLRSQTQRLKQITRETSGKFLIPTLSSRKIVKRINEQLLGLGPRITNRRLYQVQVGEIVSLIYAPVVAEGACFLDGITGKPYPKEAMGIEDERVSPDPPANQSFLPALCPHCGWDLEGESKSFCLHCKNCVSLWMGAKQKLIPVPFLFFGNDLKQDLFLPFWQFRIKAEGLSLGDCLERFGSFSAGKGAGAAESISAVSWKVPAFNIHPNLFLRLGRQMTNTAVEGTRLRRFPKASYFPATLPFQEGFQSLPMLIFQLSRKKAGFEKVLAGARFKPEDVKLLFVPFARRGFDLVQPDLNIGLHKNALTVGRML